MLTRTSGVLSVSHDPQLTLMPLMTDDKSTCRVGDLALNAGLNSLHQPQHSPGIALRVKVCR